MAASLWSRRDTLLSPLVAHSKVHILPRTQQMPTTRPHIFAPISALPAAPSAVLDTAAVEELATNVPAETVTADLGAASATQVVSEPPAVDVTKDQLLRQQRRARRLSR